jgi:HEAT repeat protein
MKLTSLSLLIFTLALAGCGFSQPVATQASGQARQVNLPEFVDDPACSLNAETGAPRQQGIYDRNYDAIREIHKYDASTVRQEMGKRLVTSRPLSLRLLAAAVLVLKGDERGRQFFIAQSKSAEHLGDLYITLDKVAWSAEPLTGSEADLSWAEDLMIEALQNRTRVNRRDVMQLPPNITWNQPTVEVRELAVQYGHFGDHLARMRSVKALPVLISLLREYPFYSLKTSIGYLGRYRDERVESLLLDILKAHRDAEHEDTYRFAVSAASEMGLKAAVPVLLRHLDDHDSYQGLRFLADAGVIPTIKAALPRLKSYARAEAELTLVHLRGGDSVPSLLKLLRRKDYLLRSDVMMRLAELRDARTVPTISSALCYDPDSFVRSWSIRVLAAVGNREAIRGLVDGLGCDYSKLNWPKLSREHDNDREYKNDIADALKEITGENFGVDQERWARWLDQRKGL